MNVVEKNEYFYSNHTGDAVMTVYKVFPGVELVYNSVHMNRFNRGELTVGNYIEIHHCLEGRMEQEFDNGNLYLMPGDLSIAIRDKTLDAYIFPLHHYHGITIAIDINVFPKCFSELLSDVFVEPLEVARRLCQTESFFVLRGEKYIEHIFSEIYDAPEKGRIGYFKVKIMELFLMLNKIDLEQVKPANNSVPRSNVILAKEVAEYLSCNLNSHITIPELAKQFNISPTYLKNVFRDVYGTPIYKYVRMQKMQLAAQLLLNTNCTILQIAGDCGYTNSGKFSAAFKEVMGETPFEYRKNHHNNQET